MSGRETVVDINGVTMKYYRQIIKIGNSLGVTFPKKLLPFDIVEKDYVEITVKKVRK